jgi:oligopeptide/dipeptide ABC transporter ATP-binding protein
MLDRVKIANAERRAHDYPHMFSGGMCQRVMIAMALASEPELLIADEPTTALDVTVQSAILDLLRELQRELGIAVLYITHDLAVVSELCDRVAVMYAGETVEVGGTSGVFHQPQHPYTGGLLQAIPRHASATRLVEIPGQVPNAHEMPAGCRFAPRCPYVVPDRCTSAPVELLRSGDRTCRCVRRSELDLEGMSG